ncbi:MAG: class I SAM-dependent methyltransferase [Verrucomicrobiota bacterium]
MWLGTKLCQERINRRISGDNIHWLEYSWRQYVGPAVARSSHPHHLRCLILGSNEGWMEMMLCEHGFTGAIVASDIADKAVSRARAKVEAAGYRNVTHVVADLNVDSFEGKFDFIICEGVLHHIANIERCLRMLRSCMKPDALLFAVEFEGPFRFQLSELQVRWINATLFLMPRSLRPLARNDQGNYPATEAENLQVAYSPPPADQIARFDPTEAYSGAELKQLLPRIFEIIQRTGFGGTLLSYMAAHFDFKRANEDVFSQAWLKVLCEIEDTLISTHILEDEFVFYILRSAAHAKVAG